MDLQSYLKQWRRSEDQFYASVLQAPELYTAGIQLVRALADRIYVPDVDGLPDFYSQTDAYWVAEIADVLELAHRDFLDYGLARDAAFYLRHRDILKGQALAQVQHQIQGARARDDEWVMLYNLEHERQGATFFQRLEMHLSDSLGIYTAMELDWERGRVYVMEPMWLDPFTGEPDRDRRPPGPKQEFSSLEELHNTVEALRNKYSHNTAEEGASRGR